MYSTHGIIGYKKTQIHFRPGDGNKYRCYTFVTCDISCFRRRLISQTCILHLQSINNPE